MMAYIAIDGGTTNTRICLVKNSKVIDILKFNVGARLGIENKKILENTIKKGIEEILKRNSLKEQDISKILASGMLTCEFGILQLDHIETPVGIKELHDSMVEITLEKISPIPFVFIRGVKTSCTNIDNADMMRGEESELIGLADDIKSCVFILPGSHSKIIQTDNEGRISEFTTMLTGEMISSISGGTILKDAVDLETSCLNEEYLLLGYEYCVENGINKSVFKTRVLRNMFSKTKSEVYSFFLGVLLCDEIKQIIKSNPEKIIIGGRKQIRDAIFKILYHKLDCEICCISDDVVENANSLGMVRIYEYNY